MIDAIHKSLQIVMLLLAIVVIGSLIFTPQLFASQAKKLCDVLDNHDFSCELTASGPKVTYTKREALAAIETQSALDAASGVSACLSSQNCSPSQQKEISDVLNLSEVPTTPTLTSEFKDFWIAVFGADKSIESANYEIDKANRAGFRTDLIFVDGWYRSVARFDNRKDAEAALPQIAGTLGVDDAYVRLLTRWCSNPQRNEKPQPFVSCEKNW